MPKVLVSRDAVRRVLVMETAAAPALGNEATATTIVRCTVRTAVERAWSEIPGHDSYAADVRLNETGGDSLDALRMWFLIEKTLVAQLSMDVLVSDPKPSQLVTALEKQLRAFPGRPVFPSSTPIAPLIFILMPPADGDSLKLERFRTAFRDSVRFVMIEYPDWREMIDGAADFDALADAAVAQIRAQTRENDPCLVSGLVRRLGGNRSGPSSRGTRPPDRFPLAH